MAQLNFNASTVAPDTGSGDPIPAGWYNVMMDESDMKPTKAGDGAYLNCRFSVMDGQYAGRKVFTNLNLRHSNPVTQEIAYKQLSAICHAVGILEIQDSQQLHGKPLKIKVKVRKATDDFEASNDISAFKNINDATAGAVGAGAPAMGFNQAPQMPVMGAPVAGMQMPNTMQQMQQAPQQMQQAPQQMQPMQQPMQMQAQAPQQQYQQPAQQQMQMQPQQAPVQQQAAVQQPWQQPDAQQPWAQQVPQQQMQQQAAPMQQPQQQMQPAQQNPVVQQMANMVPPWQQQAQ